MDEQKRDELLYRLDERTESIHEDVGEIKKVNEEHDKAITENGRIARKNRTILHLMTVGVGGTATTVAGKFSGLINF